MTNPYAPRRIDGVTDRNRSSPAVSQIMTELLRNQVPAREEKTSSNRET
jgi:hypothetical protein